MLIRDLFFSSGSGKVSDENNLKGHSMRFKHLQSVRYFSASLYLAEKPITKSKLEEQILKRGIKIKY